MQIQIMWKMEEEIDGMEKKIEKKLEKCMKEVDIKFYIHNRTKKIKNDNKDGNIRNIEVENVQDNIFKFFCRRNVNILLIYQLFIVSRAV